MNSTDPDVAPKQSEANITHDPVGETSRNPTAEAVSVPIRSSSSWWSSINIWSKSESAVSKGSTDVIPQIEPAKKDGKRETP
jgi:hypothetical protein